MNAPFLGDRLVVGATVPSFSVDTLSQGSLRIPAGRLTHLQFRRFAGCPICNRHVRRFATRLGELEAAGVKTVAFFHSSAEAMRPFQGDLPFAVVPDVEKRWYRQFGVERGLAAMLHPRSMWAAMRGSVQVKNNPFAGEGGHLGLPADVLLDADGVVRAVHYGAHADDAWSVDEVLAHARAA